MGKVENGGIDWETITKQHARDWAIIVGEYTTTVLEIEDMPRESEDLIITEADYKENHGANFMDMSIELASEGKIVYKPIWLKGNKQAPQIMEIVNDQPLPRITRHR